MSPSSQGTASPLSSNASKSAFRASSSSEEPFDPDETEVVSSSKIVFLPAGCGKDEVVEEAEGTLRTCTVTVFPDPAGAPPMPAFETPSSSSLPFAPAFANLRSKLTPSSCLEREDTEVEMDTSTWRLNAGVAAGTPEDDVVLGDTARGREEGVEVDEVDETEGREDDATENGLPNVLRVG